MNITFHIKLYFLSLLIFLGIDSVWLIKIAPNFYKTNIGHLMAEKPNLIAAGIFYLINIFGIILFAVNPALNKNSSVTAFLLGALYGLVTYATYDLTNLATLRDWPLKVTLVDIIWGMFLSSLTAGLTFLLAKKFL